MINNPIEMLKLANFGHRTTSPVFSIKMQSIPVFLDIAKFANLW